MFKHLLTALLALGLAGCTSPNADVKSVQFGQSVGIVSGANLRLVTERSRGVGYPKVVCTEPSPDYAAAFNNTRKVTVVAPSDAGERKFEGDLSSAETLTAGAGREAAVLALRDGLYTACQSYANGVIGQDAYAIILSQYGNLLVALVGKSGAADKTPAKPGEGAFAALVVACISSHDQSRSRYGQNAMLNPVFCSRVLQRALARAG
ncbi:hypothetical protein EPK99_11130 [Neorhizobium lilium]|uniref:Lipoprotein n=1 Tax=Neorhizobium lilium TaxID=2503024 RepID=A0A444LJA2_9HYPH|nr:hypothetical protein [Neorhizobium lilium]RWX79111.1 hypothetical protein EPK99_11130 [Neorhizobium lilium]